MLLHALAGTALLFTSVHTDPTAAEGQHGKLPWFEGSYAELLAKAEKEKKLIFLDFWTSW